MIRKISVFISILMLTSLVPAGVRGVGPVAGSCREITDMAGRKVNIPENITKVLATSPPPSTFVYMIAPEKLGGWFFSPAGQAQKYIRKNSGISPCWTGTAGEQL